MESEDLRRRVDNSYEKYGWTEEQQETFEKFMAERYLSNALSKDIYSI